MRKYLFLTLAIVLFSSISYLFENEKIQINFQKGIIKDYVFSNEKIIHLDVQTQNNIYKIFLYGEDLINNNFSREQEIDLVCYNNKCFIKNDHISIQLYDYSRNVILTFFYIVIGLLFFCIDF